jgi:PKD repeat protein
MVGSNQGNIVWEWHVKDHLIQDKFSDKKNYGVIADHPELININYVDKNGFGIYDWLHINSVDFNPELNQIMMSPLFFNELWVIEYNGNTADAKGHTKGTYKKGGDLLYRWGNPETYDRGNAFDRMVYNMHNPHWIKPGLKDAGKIMFFHNGISRPSGTFSSVDIIIPPVNGSGEYIISSGLSFGPASTSWTYSNPGKFYSAFLSGAERLPNGNTFICSGGPGKFFEIDANKKIVWEFVNPMTSNGPVDQGSPSPNSSVFRSTRYPSDFKGFKNVSLTGGNPLESKPMTSLCKKAYEVAPICNFTASKQNLLVDEETILTDQSTGFGITGRKWKITDEDGKSQNVFIVAGDTNSSASVTAKFGVKGFYSVRLEVTNPYGNDVEVKTSYLNVSQKTEGIVQMFGENRNYLVIYPNPSNDRMTISGYGFDLNGAELVLKDIMGRSLLQISDISGSAVIDIGKLGSGIYEVMVCQEGNCYHKKIQVLKN